MNILPKTDSAIEFLRKLRPVGPWVLTSILPNKGIITTQTFKEDQLVQMKEWIDRFQSVRNIYYTLNSVRESVTSKPTKAQISELVALHCDCDPRPFEDFAEERVRILDVLNSFSPKPSIIVDSGNGFQAIFLLQEKIPLDGTIETAEEYEAYNRQLEILLEGDHCFNVDRVLRLPGTINIPDEKKIKKGRVPTVSSVLDWNDQLYSLKEFAKTPTKIQQVGIGIEELPSGVERVKISGNVAPIYIDDLTTKNIKISDSVKVLIVQGHNPDVPGQFPSRSEALWAVVCELVRAGADDEVIAGIIMNRDNKISASVLDKPRPERYAAKQIQDAKEEVADPILREMNSRHAVISDLGGKCRIISEAFDYSLNRSKISYQSFQDFTNRYCNKKVQIATDGDGKPITKPAGKWWIDNPQRRQYDTVVFSPGKDVPQAYNLWQGFACEAIPGDVSLFLNHVLENICQGNKEYNNYLLSWMARAVQQPDCQGEVAIVLRGEMGTGKSIFAKHFGSLFGRHFLQISDSKHLIGNFNSHLRDAVVLFSDEALYAGDKKHESILKALVTESTLVIESKGLDIVAAANYVHLILASNSNWVIPAGNNERRFFVLDIGISKMQDKKYFSAISAQMDKGGREALLYYLLNYEISSFEVRDVPKTLALQDQKLLSMSNEEAWWFEKLEEGRLLREHDNWEREVQKNGLQDDYIAFMQRVGIMRKSSPTALGKFLGRVSPGGMPKSYQRMAKIRITNGYGEEIQVTRRVYFYEIPDLDRCRTHWDKHHGGPFKWSILIDPQIQFPDTEPENVFK